MVKIKNPWGDGRDAAVLDENCAFRPCLHIGEDKGPFTQGVGYTSYYANPKLCCMHNHIHGCPRILPAVDSEKARCCPAPDFARPRKSARPPRRQRCRTCGAWMGGVALELARGLPQHSSARCPHGTAKPTEWVCRSAWQCTVCSRWWDKKPRPHDPGETLDAFAERRRTEDRA